MPPEVSTIRLSDCPLVDARGKPCPLPIVELAQGLRQSEFVELWADDPAVTPDLAALCACAGHVLVRSVDHPFIRALVRRNTLGSAPLPPEKDEVPNGNLRH